MHNDGRTNRALAERGWSRFNLYMCVQASFSYSLPSSQPCHLKCRMQNCEVDPPPISPKENWHWEKILSQPKKNSSRDARQMDLSIRYTQEPLTSRISHQMRIIWWLTKCIERGVCELLTREKAIGIICCLHSLEYALAKSLIISLRCCKIPKKRVTNIIHFTMTNRVCTTREGFR